MKKKNINNSEKLFVLTLLQYVKQNVLIIDARYPYEYNGGHISTGIGLNILEIF